MMQNHPNNYFSLAVIVCLIVCLSGCISNINAPTSQELEIAKWHYDRGNYDNNMVTIEKYAQQHYPDAEYILGYSYFYGKGKPINRKLANVYLQRAAQQQYYPALLALKIIADAEKNNMSVVSYAADTSQDIMVKKKLTKSHPIQTTLDHKLIYKINPSFYTVLMVTTIELKQILTIVDSYQLYDGYYIYKYRDEGVIYYGLINGKYQQQQDAKYTINNLPQMMRKWSPRILTFAMIHAKMVV